MIMQVQGFKFHQIHLALYDLNVGDLIYDLNLRYSIRLTENCYITNLVGFMYTTINNN